MTEIKTVVFDLDDTLFSERQFARSGIRAAHDWQMERFGHAGFLDTALEIYAGPFQDRLFDRALEALSIQMPKDALQEMVRVFREHLPISLELHEDAQWALDQLRGKKNLGVISDGYLIPQQNKVKVLGLEKYFDPIIYAESFGGREFWKPHPISFEKMMARFGGEPASFLYVADNPLRDFVAPRRMGWRTAHIDRPTNLYYKVEAPADHRADSVISSLRELPIFRA